MPTDTMKTEIGWDDEKEAVMSERVFFIGEVIDPIRMVIGGLEIIQCLPKDNFRGEKLWLHPSHIMKESELLNGAPQKGEYFFSPDYLTWEKCVLNDWPEEDPILVHRPFKPEPKSPIDQWLDSAPTCVGEDVKEWIRRRPGKEV